VDDNATFREAVQLLLEDEPDIDLVGESPDATDGVARARELQPDFVLLDYLLPGLSGARAAPLFRQAAPNARIVAITSFLIFKPDWADALLNKTNLDQIVSFLRSLQQQGQ